MGVLIFIIALGLPYALVLLGVILYRVLCLTLRLSTSLIRAPDQGHIAPAVQPEDAETIVILIHGTFARGAAWTRPGSALRDAVTDDIKHAVAFETLNWSGRNSLRARTAASTALRARLRASLATFPDKPHFVVAHSHGGNIAMSALSDDGPLQENVRLICLSTPFIVLRLRQLSAAVQLFNVLFPFVLCIGLINLAHDYDLLPDTDLVDVISFFTAVGFAVLFYRMTLRIVMEIVEANHPPTLHRSNVLLVRTLADEATIGIAAANLASKVTHALLHLPMTILGDAHEVTEHFREKHGTKGRFAWLAGLTVLIPALILFAQTTPSDAQTYLLVLKLAITSGAICIAVAAFLTTGGGWLLMLAMFLLSILAFPVIALMFLLSLAAGSEMALAGLYLEATAESTPTGEWHVTLVDGRENNDEAKVPFASLQHSLAYQNPTALRYMTKWMAAQISTDPAAPRTPPNT